MAGRQILETERLLLREFDEGDVGAYYALGSDPAVLRYVHVEPLASVEQALESLRSRPLADYRKHGFGRWACVLKATGEVVGWSGLKRLDDLEEVDLGYWLMPAFWGRGLATEAGRAVLKYGFESLRLEQIIGLVDPANVASVRVLEKVGMTRAGVLEHRGVRVDRYVARGDGGPEGS